MHDDFVITADPNHKNVTAVKELMNVSSATHRYEKALRQELDIMTNIFLKAGMSILMISLPSLCISQLLYVMAYIVMTRL